MVVDDFITWSRIVLDQKMKAEFYPRINKADFFKLGYVATKSSYTLGSTMDLTIVPFFTFQQEIYHQGQKLMACYDTHLNRFSDNGINIETGFDCMDETASPDNKDIRIVSNQNCILLQ